MRIIGTTGRYWSALALMVVCVSALGGQIAFGRNIEGVVKRHGFGVDVMASRCGPFLSKRVNVIGDGPENEGFLAVQNSLDFLLREWDSPVWVQADRSRPQIATTCIPEIMRRHNRWKSVSVNRERVASGNEIKTVSGSCPEVVNLNAYCKGFPSSPFARNTAMGVNVGSQLPRGGFLGVGNKFTGRSPQSVGEERQYASNYGEYRGRWSDDRIENPLPKRTAVMWIGLLLAPVLSFMGCKCIFYNHRLVLGGLLLGASAIVAFGGVGLLLLTGFRSTWGWGI